MLGWCMECHQLKPITAIGQGWNRIGLGIDYAPVNHDAPPTHTGCGGVVRFADTNDDALECERCVQPVPHEHVTPGDGRCRGSRRPIR